MYVLICMAQTYKHIQRHLFWNRLIKIKFDSPNFFVIKMLNGYLFKMYLFYTHANYHHSSLLLFGLKLSFV